MEIFLQIFCVAGRLVKFQVFICKIIVNSYDNTEFYFRNIYKHCKGCIKFQSFNVSMISNTLLNDIFDYFKLVWRTANYSANVC